MSVEHSYVLIVAFCCYALHPQMCGQRYSTLTSEPQQCRCTAEVLRACGACCYLLLYFVVLQAPWILCLIEVATLMLLLLLLVPHRPPGPYSFDYTVSLEDVVLLGALRALALASTYACGSSSLNLRYMAAGVACGARTRVFGDRVQKQFMRARGAHVGVGDPVVAEKVLSVSVLVSVLLKRVQRCVKE